jgi:hypothetical protein
MLDLATWQWGTSGDMTSGRSDHVATLLGNGDVLAVGGYGPGSQELARAERCNPATGAWTPAGAMANPRLGHRATLLADGRVLVSGGYYTALQPGGWLLAINVTTSELL